MSSPTKPLVSVVIPAYNSAAFIEESVRSVLAQDVPDIEVIVVDDSSTDNTAQVVAAIADPRVRVVQNNHGGCGAARKKGMEHASGRFLAFIDADDRWREGKLKRQLALLDSEPNVGFVFTNLRRFDTEGYYKETQFDLSPEIAGVATRPSRAGGGKVITDDTFLALVGIPQLPCITQTIVIRSDVLGSHTFRTDQRAEDLCFMVTLYQMTPGAFIEDPLVELRRHGNNTFKRGDELLVPNLDALTAALPTVTAPVHRAALRRRIGLAWMKAGYHYLWSGRVGAAANAYIHALAYPGVRRKAIVRLAVTPLAPILARRSPEDLTAAFPSGRL